MTESKINLGSGTQTAPGFINFDNSPNALASKVPYLRTLLFKLGFLTEEQLRSNWSEVKWRDLTRGLPFKANSVVKIYSSHFLEHVPPNKAVRILKDCYRILHPDGIMRLVVPDLLYHAERYVRRTRAQMQLNDGEPDRRAHDEFLKTISGHYLYGRRKGLEHCYMYDLPSLLCTLRKVGFKEICVVGYREGTDLELARLDCRPHESLHLELRK